MATASRTSTFTPRFAGGPEQYIKDKVEDVVFNANIYMWLLKKMGRIDVGNWGHTHVVNVQQNRGAAAETGRHLDPVTFSVPDGPQSMLFEYGEYRKGIAYSMSEAADNGGSERAVDAVQARIDTEVLTFTEGINTDLIYGNAADSLKVSGLLQAIYPEDHITNEANTATRAMMRQTITTYGGITRVANGGTGLENVSVSLDASVNDGFVGSSWTDGTDNVFKLGSNNEPSKAKKALDNVFQYGCTYGKTKPNCILSSPRPWLDWQNMTVQTVRYAGGSTDDGADLGIPYIMYLGAMWGVEEQLVMNGAVGDAATASDTILILNMDTIHLKVEKGWFFDPSREWSQFPNQVADGTILLFRAFHEVHNPRYNGILFNYGVA